MSWEVAVGRCPVLEGILALGVAGCGGVVCPSFGRGNMWGNAWTKEGGWGRGGRGPSSRRDYVHNTLPWGHR